jgi:hypothetical protein
MKWYADQLRAERRGSRTTRGPRRCARRNSQRRRTGSDRDGRVRSITLDEGRAYATALRSANIPVTYLEFPRLVHGFFALASFRRARAERRPRPAPHSSAC